MDRGDRQRFWEMRFVVASLLVVAVIAFTAQGLLGAYFTRRLLWVQAMEAQATMVQVAEALTLFDWSKPLGPEDVEAVDLVIERSMLPIELLKVWSADGTVLYSTQHSLIGRTFAPDEGLEDALQGRPHADLSNLDEDENVVERGRGLRQALETYIPIVVDGRVVGAFETYTDAAPLTTALAGMRQRLDLTLFGGMAVLWLVLWWLAHGMAANLRRQNRDLRNLHDALEGALHRAEDTLNGALAALAEAVEAKDEYVGGHVGRVAAYAEMVADELGLTGPARDTVVRGALLHDIGKMAIPDSILGKPGPLTPKERTMMETHAARGEAIVRRIPALEGSAAIVRHHHERWEGGGYPDGLRAEDIPLGARIVAVADAFDAMTTDRVYRRALTYEHALRELDSQAGHQFDPQVVAALKRGLMRMAERPDGVPPAIAVPPGAAQAALAAGD